MSPTASVLERPFVQIYHLLASLGNKGPGWVFATSEIQQVQAGKCALYAVVDIYFARQCVFFFFLST